MNKFIELHNILPTNINTCSTINEKELIKKAIDNNLPGIGIVDYYEINSLIKFKKTLKEMNIKNFKTIYGVVLNIKVENNIYEGILYPINNQGLKELYKLVYLHSKNNYLDIYDYMNYEDNITIGISINTKENDRILEYFDFIEVSYKNKELIKELDKYAVILTNKPNRLDKDDLPNKVLSYYKNSSNVEYGYYLTSEELNDIPEEIINNNFNLFNMLENIDEYFDDNNYNFEIINTIYKNMNNLNDEEIIRINKELDIIKNNNLTSIFYYTYKIFEEAKKLDNLVFIKTPLDHFFISYLLKMTPINPIKLNLEIPTNINEINIEIIEDIKEELINNLMYLLPNLSNKIMFFTLSDKKIDEIIKNYKNNNDLSNESYKYIKEKLKDIPYKKHIYLNKYGFNNDLPKISFENKIIYTNDSKDIKNNIISLTIKSSNYINFLKRLERITNLNVDNISLEDSKTLKIFKSLEILNITPDKLYREVGNVGLAYFNNHYVSYALSCIKPNNIYELINTFSYNLNNIKEYKDINKFLLNENKDYSNKIYKTLMCYYYAYYKLYYPLEFYKTMLEGLPFLYKEILIGGYEKIKDEYLFLNDIDIETLEPKKLNLNEYLLQEVLEYALEISLRNISFEIDYNQIEKVKINKEKNVIIIKGSDNDE